jgi:serine acetyltransferase
MSDTQKAEQALAHLNELISNDNNYDYYDFENKRQFYIRAFSHQMQELFGIDINEMSDIDKGNVNHLFEMYFRQTL